MTLPLTMAISPYDHVRDLASGRVRVEGVDLRCLELPVEEIFFRTRYFADWDVAEMSLAKYAALGSQGSPELVGLPVFPSRVFRHSSIYVHGDRITSPADLRHGRVGVPEWAQTASVYTRGLLTEDFGVPLNAVRWSVAGVNAPGRREKVELAVPGGVDVTWLPERCLDDMLRRDELDAVFSAHPPAAFGIPDSGVRRLFPDYAEVEYDYAQRTGVVPIMHLVVVRRAVAEQHPWVLANLVDAFEQARAASIARLHEVTASRFPLLWAHREAERTRELFGGTYWPYGLEANRRTLELFLRWAAEQGVTQRRLAPEDLFPESVRTRFVI